ncbi:MAG: hypothetical protein EPN84_08830 [Legionella sp.]|nr:MAG: hypothetical protein EPN84_08830 [Legionella sp.]
MKKSEFKTLLDAYSEATKDTHTLKCKFFDDFCVQKKLHRLYVDMRKMKDDDLIAPPMATKIYFMANSAIQDIALTIPQNLKAEEVLNEIKNATAYGLKSKKPIVSSNDDDNESAANVSSINTSASSGK